MARNRQTLTASQFFTMSSLFKVLLDDKANLALFVRDLGATDDIDFLLYEWEGTLAFEQAEPAAVIAILDEMNR